MEKRTFDSPASINHTSQSPQDKPPNMKSKAKRPQALRNPNTGRFMKEGDDQPKEPVVQTKRFSDLPAEVRNRIYCFALYDQCDKCSPIWPKYYEFKKFPAPWGSLFGRLVQEGVLPLAHVSSQVRAEVLSSYISQTLWIWKLPGSNASHFDDWARSLNPSITSCVQHLRIDVYGRVAIQIKDARKPHGETLCITIMLGLNPERSELKIRSVRPLTVTTNNCLYEISRQEIQASMGTLDGNLLVKIADRIQHEESESRKEKDRKEREHFPTSWDQDLPEIEIDQTRGIWAKEEWSRYRADGIQVVVLNANGESLLQA